VLDAFAKEIQASVEVLKTGGIILYPTDTVWGIGCDATDEKAVERIYRLKKQSPGKALICLVGSDAMLERHVEQVPEVAWDIMDLSTKPTTIVYDRPVGFARNILAEDNSLPIRVTSDKFCRYLIGAFKKPIVSTAACIAESAAPKGFSEIPELILKGVDYVVNLQRDNRSTHLSSMIKLGNDGTVKVIRE
jgi:L-threonylcarbamoyladenylate synthase